MRFFTQHPYFQENDSVRGLKNGVIIAKQIAKTAQEVQKFHALQTL
jgi:hypothetical protein